MNKYRIAYFFLIVAAVVFSVCYAGRFSTIILLSVLAMPLVSLLTLIISRIFLKISLEDESIICRKSERFSIRFKVFNRSPFVLAPVVVQAVTPESLNPHAESDMILGIAPFAKKTLETEFVLKYRGQYTFELKHAEIYDMMKLFRFRIRLSQKKTVMIFPRHTVADGDGASTGGEHENPMVHINDVNGSELNFIRKYADGDSLHNIHWKLSAKQDEYMVKQMARNQNVETIIFCDFYGYFDDGEKNLSSVDTAVETALAISYQSVQNEEEVVNCWYDAGQNETKCITATTTDEYWQLFYRYASAPVYSDKTGFADAAEDMLGGMGQTGVVYFVTPHIDEKLFSLVLKIAPFMNMVFVVLTADGSDKFAEELSMQPKVRVGSVDGEQIVSGISAIQSRNQK